MEKREYYNFSIEFADNGFLVNTSHRLKSDKYSTFNGKLLCNNISEVIVELMKVDAYNTDFKKEDKKENKNEL